MVNLLLCELERELELNDCRRNWKIGNERNFIGIKKILKDIELELIKMNCNDLERELELIEWN